MNGTSDVGRHGGPPQAGMAIHGEPVPCRMGLGCARIGSFNNPANSRDTQRLLERALELGVDLFDTADIYGQGDSEREIGRILKSRPGAAFVVTKVGHAFSRPMAALRPLKPLIKPLISRSGAGRRTMTSLRKANVTRTASTKPEGIAPALEASLRRLRLERVDALLLHDCDVESVRNPAVAEALARLERRGLIGVYGASCVDAETLSAATAMPGISIVEASPSMVDALEPEARRSLGEMGIAVLMREVVSSRPDLTPLEALRWAAGRYADARIVVGTTSMLHLEQAAGAIEGVALACDYGARSGRPHVASSAFVAEAAT